MTKRITADKGLAGLAGRLSATLRSLLPRIPAWPDLMLGAVAIAAFVASLMLRRRLGFAPPVLACAAVAAVGGILALMTRLGVLRGREGIARHLPLFSVILAHLVALTIWKMLSFKRLEAAPSWWYFLLFVISIGALTGWAAAHRPLHNFVAKAAAFCEARLSTSATRRLFAASVATVALLVCWYTPFTLYASDPDFFYESLPMLAARLTLRGIIFIAAIGLFFRLASPRLKPLLSAAMAWVALAALLFTFAAPGDYGAMNGFLLQNPTPLRTRLAFLVDLAVFVPAGFAVWAALRHKKDAIFTGAAPLTTLLQGICLALAAAGFWQTGMVSADARAGSAQEASTRLPDYTGDLFGFSRQGHNTVVVMLGMFTGGHLPAILAKDPGLRAELDGFVWYQDSIAPGATTLLSIAAIMGGENYTPPAINARKPASLVDEMHKGFAVLPDILVPQGYQVALADVEGLDPALFAKICPSAPKTLVVGKSFGTAYTGYWRAQKGLPSPLPESRAPFLASVGLFRAAPWVLRPHIYHDGSWLNTRTVIHNPSEGSYALLDVLPQISNADRSGNTVKYFTSMASRYPWRLDGETCMPTENQERHTLPDGSIAEHVDAERCALRALARWLAWMKTAGVYDNTQIILVSDHDGGDSPVYGKQFDPLRRKDAPWKPNALLLVKSRDARGTLRTSEAPMSSADVAPLLCAENGPCPGIDQPDPRIAPPDGSVRARTHSSGLASIRRHEKGKFLVDTFVITGTGSDPANWRKENASPAQSQSQPADRPEKRKKPS